MTAATARTILRVLLGVALLVVLAIHVDVRQVVAAFRRSDPLWIFAGAIAFAIATLVACFRLQVLFSDARLPFRSAVRLTLASYFFNQLLPTGVGGDAYRSVRLKTVSGGWISAIGPLAIERTIGALSLLVPALAYRWLARGSADFLVDVKLSGRTQWLMAIAAVVLVIVGALVTARAWEQVKGVLRSMSPKTLGGVIALSMLFHAFRVVGMYAFVLAVGHRVPFGDLVAVLALALLASLVPLSIGALGIREGVLVYALGVCGVPAPEALTVALLNRLVLVVVGLAGAFVTDVDR